MGKSKYSVEFEIRASSKMLYPYISTPSGLAQWFADDVNLSTEKIYDFIWDGSSHFAIQTNQRLNKFVRFDFLEDNKTPSQDPSFIEFRLDLNELTQSSFLRITDYSEVESEEDVIIMWTTLVAVLKETVGG